MYAILLVIQTLVSINFFYNIIEADFELVTFTELWSGCMRFEYMYGSRKLVKEIYKASLLCLKPDLRSSMAEEFEQLKEEFMYELIVYLCKMYITYIL